MSTSAPLTNSATNTHRRADSETPSSNVKEQGSAPEGAIDPRGFARVAVLGVLWSLMLLALAVVAGHDVLSYMGALSGPAWIEQVLNASDGIGPKFWWVPIAALAVTFGLCFVVVALKPRPRVGIQVQAATGVFLLDRGIRHLVSEAAVDVDGVDSASATRRGRTLRVEVRGLSAERDGDLEARVSQVLTERLSPLQKTPNIQVRDRGRR